MTANAQTRWGVRVLEPVEMRRVARIGGLISRLWVGEPLGPFERDGLVAYLNDPVPSYLVARS